MKLQPRQFSGPPAMHYVEGPDAGPPLLLLHGVLRDGRDWEPLLSELICEWRVIALDHCGHGGSARTPGAYHVADYARHAAAFVRETFSEPVTVMGHSLGAMVALSLAVECESQVAAILLEDPPFHTMGRDIAATPYQALFQGMAEVTRRGGSVTEMADGLAAIRLSETQRLGDVRDRASLEFSAECLAQVDPEVFVPLVAGRWLDGFDAAKLWPRVACPVLLLQGDPAAGGAFTDADASTAIRSLRDQRHIRFARTGHQIHRERTQEVLAAFRDFAR